MKQRIEFLKLVAQLASNATFERKLDLDANDIEFYKKQFDIESQDDARRLYKRLEIEQFEGREEMIISENSKARSAEEVANKRLKELEAERAAEKRSKAVLPDGNKIHAEDAERQRRFTQEQLEKEAEVLEKLEEWQLPLDVPETDKKGIIDRFRRDIENNGLTFCHNKYHATSAQIKAEAIRLKLRINWDRVKR
jgi:hypothetical protein